MDFSNKSKSKVSSLLVTNQGELIFLGEGLFQVLGIEEFQKELYFKLKP